MPHALITGANRGLGLEHVSQLLKREWTISAAVRDPEGADALKALDPGDGRLTILPYDASDLNAAQALKDKVTGPLDILFANAGVMGPKEQAFGEAANDGFLDTFRINTLAPLALAELCHDSLRARACWRRQTSRPASAIRIGPPQILMAFSVASIRSMSWR